MQLRPINCLAASLLLLAGSACLALPPSEATPQNPYCENPAPLHGIFDSRAPGYMVSFKPGTKAVEEVERLGGLYELSIGHVYKHGTTGFSAGMSEETRERIRCEPSIRFVEFDGVAFLAAETTPSDDSLECVCGVDRVNRSTGDGEASMAKEDQASLDACHQQGLVLVRTLAASGNKTPPNYRGQEFWDADKLAGVVYVTRPSAARIVGSYKMTRTLVYAASREEAERETRDFFVRASAMQLWLPDLAEYEIVDSDENRFFYEFYAPSKTEGKVVSFRVWKSSFFRPTVGWLLTHAGRTGSTAIGALNKSIDAADFSFFLEGIWWENRNIVGAKVLALPKVEETRGKLVATMPTSYFVGGDWGVKDRVGRHQWSVTLERDTGNTILEIVSDMRCAGVLSKLIRFGAE